MPKQHAVQFNRKEYGDPQYIVCHYRFCVPMRQIAALSCLMLLAACTSPLQRLESANPEANNFPTALASEYQSYAESESEQGHHRVAQHFAEKGVQALKGQTPPPELPDYNLPKRTQRRLAFARTRLMDFLTPDMKRVAPQKLARAQLLFDCWQHQVARRLSENEVPCSEEFAAALSDLQSVQDGLRYGPEASHVITFAPGSTALDAKDLEIVEGVAQALKQKNYYIVELHTYMGRRSVQHSLSEERLMAVRQALIKAGVSHRGIRFKKEGGASTVLLEGEPLTSKKITIIVKTREH